MPIRVHSSFTFIYFWFPERFLYPAAVKLDGEQILMLMVSFFCVHYSMIVSYSHGSGAGLPFSVSLAVPLIDSKNNGFNYM